MMRPLPIGSGHFFARDPNRGANPLRLTAFALTWRGILMGRKRIPDFAGMTA